MNSFKSSLSASTYPLFHQNFTTTSTFNVPHNLSDTSSQSFYNATFQLTTPLCPRLMDSTFVNLATTMLVGTVMVVIVFLATAGNSLVIVGVLKVRRLRVVPNSFIASMAVADLLVTLCVMPLNASQELCGRWLFDKVSVVWYCVVGRGEWDVRGVVRCYVV